MNPILPGPLLPGHRLTRATVLDLGLFDVGPGRRTIGIPGFLLETDQGAKILFDTGFPPEYATDYDATAARDDLPRFGRLVDYGHRQTLPGQLALLGLAPQDITHVILSHGHIDHVGALPLFTHCPIILTDVERTDLQPCYFFDARPIDWPETDYIRLTAPTPLCAGIELIPTPGHTAGHLSALIALPSGQSYLLAADAINRISEPEEGFADARDPAAAMASFHHLTALQQQHQAIILYGHEPTQWPALPKAPTPLA